jgi:hypothetical protein
MRTTVNPVSRYKFNGAIGEATMDVAVTEPSQLGVLSGQSTRFERCLVGFFASCASSKNSIDHCLLGSRMERYVDVDR